jgi:transcriptional regulator with XRE-family HTH domain
MANTSNWDNICGFLCGVREDRRLSPDDVAEKAGCTGNTVRNLESGAAVNSETLMSVCEALGVRLQPRKVQ